LGQQAAPLRVGEAPELVLDAGQRPVRTGRLPGPLEAGVNLVQGGGRGRKRLGKGLVHSTVSSPSRPRPVGETVRKGDTPRGGGGCWRRWSPPGIMLRAARCPGGVSPWGVEPRAPGPAGPRPPCRRRLRRGRGLQDHVAAVSRRAFGQPGGPSIVGAPPPACQDGHAGYRKKTLRRLPEKSAPSLPQFRTRCACRTWTSTTARNSPRAGWRITTNSPSTMSDSATSRPASLSPRAHWIVRNTSPGPAASTCQAPVTSSGLLPGTKIQRLTVPLFSVAGSRSASQRACVVSALGRGGMSRARTAARKRVSMVVFFYLACPLG